MNKKNKLLLCLIAWLGVSLSVQAADLSSLNWGQVCSGQMGAAWYGSAESQAVADIVLSVQKANGGWMKNDQLHQLSATQLATLQADRNGRSCLDNAATTMEMRFLAKVYQGCQVEKYREAFGKGLQLIFTAEKANGGWSQYWPLSGNGSYHDYITFNDNLMTNVMKLLRDIQSNTGDSKDIVDEATREQCQTSFDKGLEVILKCQVDDNGTKSAWCAQHDPVDFLPTEGRPHEHPSVSGSESAALLSFLMTLPNPSAELQAAINAGVTWLDAHKIEGKAIEDYTNGDGVADRRIVDRPGSAIWGRFIQLGGEKAKQVYTKFFNKLLAANKTRSYTYGGVVYTYKEYDIATSSYQEDKAYQPVFGIYSNDYAHLFYRFLYNYEDTPPVVDSKGVPVATSLMAENRRNYQYLGSWGLNVINVEYPAWKQRMEALNDTTDATPYELSAVTYLSSESTTYNFQDGLTVSNTAGKGYATGSSNTVKYSANVDYTITLPKSLSVEKIAFYGYDNYDADAYLSQLNGVTYASTDYVFPAKVGGTAVFVTHTIDLASNPATGTLGFKLGNKQCCLIVTLYGKLPTGVEKVIHVGPIESVKWLYNGRVYISKGGKTYDFGGKVVVD
jgi:PelA/Pel-15E family pectate lyase